MTALAEPAIRPAANGRLPGSALVAAGLAALLLGGSLPWLVTSKITLSLIAQASFDMLLATSAGFLVLQNGRVSFGQAAFSGLGGYTFGALVAHGLLDPELALIVAVGLPIVVAFLLGLVIARVTGVAHAMLTLAVGQACYEVAFRWHALAKGDDGMSFDLPARIFGVPSRMLQDPAFMAVFAWSTVVVVLVGLCAVRPQPHRSDCRRHP